MGRNRRMSGKRKLALLVSVAGVVGGGLYVATGMSNAAENCAGLDQALQNNQNFIAGQQANPDAQSGARIANRQAVVNLIQQRRAAAGCNGAGGAAQAQQQNNAAAQNKGSGENCAGLDQALKNNQNFIAGQQANPDAQSAARIANRQAVVNLIQQRRAAAGCNGAGGAAQQNNAAQNNAAQNNAAQNNQAQQQNNAAQNNNAAQGKAAAGKGQQVCQGNITFFGNDNGKDEALSSQFPPNTKLHVLNNETGKAVDVTVTGGSGSCILLNTTAFNKLHLPGKNVIRDAVVTVD